MGKVKWKDKREKGRKKERRKKSEKKRPFTFCSFVLSSFCFIARLFPSTLQPLLVCSHWEFNGST